MMRNAVLAAEPEQRISGKNDIGHLYRANIRVPITDINNRVIVRARLEQLRALATSASLTRFSRILKID
jgi:hypothetical protein